MIIKSTGSDCKNLPDMTITSVYTTYKNSTDRTLSAMTELSLQINSENIPRVSYVSAFDINLPKIDYENGKVKNLTLNIDSSIVALPDIIKVALSCIDDDVAAMVIYFFGKYIKCTDVKHNVIWVWHSEKKLWVEGSQETLAHIIASQIRPIILEHKRHQKLRCKNENEAEFIIYRKIVNLSNKLGTVSYCKNIAQSVKMYMHDPHFIDKLDNDNDVLPIMPNQLMNMKTGEIRERVFIDYYSFECPVSYIADAKSDTITSFLNDITLGDKELEYFLQSILGFCLTGHTYTQKMFILYGPEGANGKSTLIDMMAKVLGPFFVQAHKEVFLKIDGGRAGGASPYLAELRGRRMAVFSESEVGDKINESQIKTFTGGDRIKCRPLYKNEIEYMPHFKPFLLTNNKPLCTTDAALWRRLVMILFNCRFVETPLLANERLKDENFKDKVFNDSNSMNAFFNWLVIGAKRMYTETLRLPKCVVDSTDEYKLEQDIYSRFVVDRIERSNDTKCDWKIPAAKLFESFTEWYNIEEGTEPINNKTFATNIKKILGESQKKTTGWFYMKCRLIMS